MNAIEPKLLIFEILVYGLEAEGLILVKSISIINNCYNRMFISIIHNLNFDNLK